MIRSIAYWQMTILAMLTGAHEAAAAPPAAEWREVLYQAFQSGALSATIMFHDQHIRIPMGWDSVPEPKEPDQRWTMARWDGGNDRRTVDRTYLVTNANGLPGCWLTRILSYQVGPDFELQCIMLNYGTPAALTMRVMDDEGLGYEATVSMGVESRKNEIRHIVKPRLVRIVDGERTVEPEKTKVVAVGEVSLPPLTRLQWYRPKLSYQEGRLMLSLDDRVLVSTTAAEPRGFSAVQFMSAQRIFLDDFEMWGTVRDGD